VGRPSLEPEALYEQARSAGLTHKTALDVSRPTLRPRPSLTGDWPDLDTEPCAGEEQWPGELPIEPMAWLSLYVRSLPSSWVMPALAKRGLPIIMRARVRVTDWWTDGCVTVDLELRHEGGASSFASRRVPVRVAVNHDHSALNRVLLRHLTDPHVLLVQSTLLNETSLRHVSG
jgi:hypothetical protein